MDLSKIYVDNEFIQIPTVGRDVWPGRRGPLLPELCPRARLLRKVVVGMIRAQVYQSSELDDVG